ncbi:MAG: cobalt transporter CbiM [Spirochaetaceae bacterium]|jgi:cobalt/nickel transport system permease protein|nr:cobalt transporter CbiM [Spirochaetaceae bacterium]
MHISEGVLSAPVIVVGWGAAVAGIGVGLKKTAAAKLPETALVSAVLFLASLVHIPLGPSSIHLTLLGLAGILLGWSAVPALFIALLLQSILFQFGGLLSLGVNTTVMGTAALSAFGVWRLLPTGKGRPPERAIAAGVKPAAAFISGFVAVGTGTFLVTFSLFLSSRDLFSTAVLMFAANLPLAVVEGVITAFSVLFLQRMMPRYVFGPA